MDSKILKICDECKSSFFSEKSEMESLCTECSHILYGYKKCNHRFEKGSCIKCGWNANRSIFILSKINKNQILIEFIKLFFEKHFHFQVFIKDFWDADENAIGLANEKSFLAYISIDEYGKYYLALENPSFDEDLPYESGKDFNNLKILDLEKEIINHLKK